MSDEEYTNYWDKFLESLIGKEEAEKHLLLCGYPERIPLENIIKKFIFKFEEVVSFEKNIESLHGKEIEQERKLRPDQRHKEECRAIAKKIWGNNPEMTIVEILKTKEIAEIKNSRVIQKTGEKKAYTDDTVRGWINDLCPNRAPGRRPAAKKP